MAPAAPVDESWEEPHDAAPPARPEATQPLPAVAPVQAQAVVDAAPTPIAGGVALSAVDLRLIVKEMIDQAIAPLQMRLAELERRPRAPSAPAFTPAMAAPAPAAAAHAPIATAPVAEPARAPYASAMALPATAAHSPVVVRSIVPAPPPLLDVKAIERDVSIDVDITGFDGGKRKRRMIFLFVFGVLVVFGGMFFLLVDSYSNTHR
jgi:hypothetical protein